ncbi:DNA-binding protein [Candidatus Bathyarchaeota archaeon]|nr:DNA-binding protein [Candidatus Bathyarchaeota archaeon]
MVLEGRTGRICFSRLSEGEDLAEAIRKRVKESGIRAGAFVLIGSLKRVNLGYYKKGEYKPTRLNGPLEIASCTGNIAVDEKGETVIHPHIVVANEKGEAFGGHLMKDSPVGVTAELVIIEATGIRLKRAFDEKTRLNLWKLS